MGYGEVTSHRLTDELFAATFKFPQLDIYINGVRSYDIRTFFSVSFRWANFARYDVVSLMGSNVPHS